MVGWWGRAREGEGEVRILERAESFVVIKGFVVASCRVDYNLGGGEILERRCD